MTGRHDARDDQLARSKRTGLQNAARLAEMADLSADAAEERRHYLAAVAAGDRLGTLLEECAAERDRLRVIVDLACAAEVARRTIRPLDEVEAIGRSLGEAVAAEVARRAQV